uniref:cAMP-dependent protein kinase regulatory subunit n=1 Tax=Macrostomum lignano TaxID=282301 RepID=A0A1I8IXV6_9PLAT
MTRQAMGGSGRRTGRIGEKLGQTAGHNQVSVVVAVSQPTDPVCSRWTRCWRARTAFGCGRDATVAQPVEPQRYGDAAQVEAGGQDGVLQAAGLSQANGADSWQFARSSARLKQAPAESAPAEHAGLGVGPPCPIVSGRQDVRIVLEQLREPAVKRLHDERQRSLGRPLFKHPTSMCRGGCAARPQQYSAVSMSGQRLFQLPSSGQAVVFRLQHPPQRHRHRRLRSLGFLNRIGRGDEFPGKAARLISGGESPAPQLPYHPKAKEEREQLRDSLKQVAFLQDLDEEDLRRVVDAMFERRVQPNEMVIRQGEDGDNFYVIRSGCYQVIIEATQADGEVRIVHQFRDSGSFGELALLHNQPRSATVKAISPGALWAMDRRAFRAIVLPAEQRRRREFAELLEGAPSLAGLMDEELRLAAEALRPRSFGHQQVIIEEGDEADGMYFVLEGEAVVTRSGREVARVPRGGYFGEAALLEGRRRTASVVAAAAAPDGRVRTAFLPREAFGLLAPCHGLLRRSMAAYGLLKPGFAPPAQPHEPLEASSVPLGLAPPGSRWPPLRPAQPCSCRSDDEPRQLGTWRSQPAATHFPAALVERRFLQRAGGLGLSVQIEAGSGPVHFSSRVWQIRPIFAGFQIGRCSRNEQLGMPPTAVRTAGVHSSSPAEASGTSAPTASTAASAGAFSSAGAAAPPGMWRYLARCLRHSSIRGCWEPPPPPPDTGEAPADEGEPPLPPGPRRPRRESRRRASGLRRLADEPLKAAGLQFPVFKSITKAVTEATESLARSHRI